MYDVITCMRDAISLNVESCSSWPTKYMYGWFCRLISCIVPPLEVEYAKKISWIKFAHELGNFFV